MNETASEKSLAETSAKTLLSKVADIEPMIHAIRGRQVMLDSDLAELYGVETKVFNQAVKRNERRFPGRSTSAAPKLSTTASSCWTDRRPTISEHP